MKISEQTLTYEQRRRGHAFDVGFVYGLLVSVGLTLMICLIYYL